MQGNLGSHRHELGMSAHIIYDIDEAQLHSWLRHLKPFQSETMCMRHMSGLLPWTADELINWHTQDYPSQVLIYSGILVQCYTRVGSAINNMELRMLRPLHSPSCISVSSIYTACVFNPRQLHRQLLRGCQSRPFILKIMKLCRLEAHWIGGSVCVQGCKVLLGLWNPCTAAMAIQTTILPKEHAKNAKSRYSFDAQERHWWVAFLLYMSVSMLLRLLAWLNMLIFPILLQPEGISWAFKIEVWITAWMVKTGLSPLLPGMDLVAEACTSWIEILVFKLFNKFSNTVRRWMSKLGMLVFCDWFYGITQSYLLAAFQK